jgi:hypothetical protein
MELQISIYIGNERAAIDEKAFSTRSVPKCYNHDQLAVKSEKDKRAMPGNHLL